MTATLRLPLRTSSVPEARRSVVQQLEQRSREELADKESLLTSELVSNAVLHARTEVVVTAVHLGAAVQVDVSDLSPVAPVRRRHTAHAGTGRGVQLLDRLARSWEVLRHGSGKTVRPAVGTGSDPWAEFLDATWADQEL